MKTREIEKFSDCWKSLVFLMNTVKKMDVDKDLFYEVLHLLRRVDQHSIRSIHLNIEIFRTPIGLDYRETWKLDTIITDPKVLDDAIDAIFEFICYDKYFYQISGTVALQNNCYLYTAHAEQECGTSLIKIRMK